MGNRQALMNDLVTIFPSNSCNLGLEWTFFPVNGFISYKTVTIINIVIVIVAGRGNHGGRAVREGSRRHHREASRLNRCLDEYFHLNICIVIKI